MSEVTKIDMGRNCWCMMFEFLYNYKAMNDYYRICCGCVTNVEHHGKKE